MVRKRVLVEGRVQGVGYRASCAHRARVAGVGGTVRNLPNGHVEAIFEGEADVVNALVAWCEQGPRYADVRQIHVVDEDPVGDTTFRVT